MSEARINSISNENNTGGPTISGITTFSGLNFFVPPKGTTAQRPSDCPPGSVRFNTDSAKLEYFDNLQWLELEAFNVEIGISTNAAGTSGGLGNRGVFMGGEGIPGITNIIDFVTIPSTGNAIDFGDLVYSRVYSAGCSSSTRGIIAGGGNSSTIQYITISSTGDAIDFGGILTTLHRQGPGCSNSTRGVFMGRYTSPGNSNTIDYITLASTGNAQYFGDLTRIVSTHASCSSSTRGIAAGQSTIDYVTISTTGNAIYFGDLYIAAERLLNSGLSNSTRGLFAGGYASINVIQYITIATTGNSQDFGDLISPSYHVSGVSSPTRGLFGGGSNSPTNIVQYVTIPTTGNAFDFGDLTVGRNGCAACSNGHGGL